MLLQVTRDFTEGIANKDLSELKLIELDQVATKKGRAELDKEYKDRASQEAIKSRKSFDNDRNTYRIHLTAAGTPFSYAEWHTITD